MMLSFMVAALLISVLSTVAQNNIPNPPRPPPPQPEDYPLRQGYDSPANYKTQFPAPDYPLRQGYDSPANYKTQFPAPDDPWRQAYNSPANDKTQFPAPGNAWFQGNNFPANNFPRPEYAGYRDNAYLGNPNSPYPPRKYVKKLKKDGTRKRHWWQCQRHPGRPQDFPGHPQGFSRHPHNYLGPPQSYPVGGTAQQPSSAVSPTSGTQWRQQHPDPPQGFSGQPQGSFGPTQSNSGLSQGYPVAGTAQQPLLNNLAQSSGSAVSPTSGTYSAGPGPQPALATSVLSAVKLPGNFTLPASGEPETAASGTPGHSGEKTPASKGQIQPE